MGMIIRAFARLLAMGSLCGAWVLLLICCLSVPTRDFSYSTTTFGNGGKLELGIFGHCYTAAGGVKNCSTPSFGYHLNATSLPQYSANPGSLVNITQKPLTSALVFYPLAVGSTSLANLVSLVPMRIATIICLGLVFISIGAQVIAAAVALVFVTKANTALKLSFNPNTFVNPMIGNCIWFTLAALLVTAGSFLFLLVALEPAKHNKAGKNEPVNAVGGYGGSDYGNLKNGRSSVYEDPYGEKYESYRAASISGRSRASQAGKADRAIDGRRSSTRRRRNDYDEERAISSGGRRSKSRQYADEEVEDEDTETEVSRRRSVRSGHSGRRSSRSRRDETEEEEDSEEESPVRKPKRAAKRSSRRSRAAEEEDYDEGELDFAGRRVR